MAIRIPTAGLDAGTDAIFDRADGGAGAAVMQIRSGAQPASANDAATGTLLATVTLQDPAFGASASGVKGLNDPGSVTGAADGTAGWFRILQSDGTTVVTDGNVTGTGGGGDLELSNTSIATGQAVDITGGNITVTA